MTDSSTKLTRETLRIVVVDDDEQDSELLRAALTKAGFTHPITHLSNGGVTLEHFKYAKETGQVAPHLLLLDLNMPVVDGVHTLDRLRKASYFRDLPVIILSGDDDPVKRREVAHLGIFRFLKKQSNNGNVISALNDFLGLYNHEAARSAT